MSVSAPKPEVPADWEIAKTDDVCEVQNGYAFKSEYFNDKNTGLPLIRIRDVHSGRSDTFYSGPFDEKYVVNDDDLLIGMDGEFRVRKWRSSKGLLNQRVCRLIPNNKPMIADFLYYSIGAPLKQIENFTPFTTVKHISAGQIRSIELPLPPLPEQRKIAHILSTVQRAIEAQGRIIQTTTELKKSLMFTIFTEGLRNESKKQTEIGLVPKSWDIVELGSLAKVGNGSTPKRGNKAYWERGTIPWLNSTKIHDRFIIEADQFVTPLAVKECHLPKVAPNSLLVAITGQGKTLGNSAVTRIETCINQHLAYAQFYSPRILPDFVLWFMQTRYDFLRSIAHGGGSTKGALTCGFLKTLLLPVPTTDEQNEIVSIFQKLENRQRAAASKKSNLEDIFCTLLHELMTAKTRVHQMEISA